MKKAKRDASGGIICGKCGASSFVQKRTLKAKAVKKALPGGGLIAKQKLKCQNCGTYNAQ